MRHTQGHGHIEVICGSMFSGKTEELLRRVRRAQFAKQKIQVFKPIIDDRYSADHVQSHDASKVLAKPVHKAGQILELLEPNTRVVGIDEAQFFDAEIVEIAQDLAYRGIRVILAGLDQDFRGDPFGPMPRLLAIAEEVTKLSAVCVVCGFSASRSQRIVTQINPSADPKAGDEQVLVGASDHYEARCRMCHEPHPIIRTAFLPGLETHLLETNTRVGLKTMEHGADLKKQPAQG